MILKYKLFCILILSFAINSYAVNNDTINQVDKKGKKQGYWTKKYANGKSMYEGRFKDNKPVGQMIRFYESGAVKAIMDYKPGSNFCSVVFYYEDGSKSAEGYFFDNKKDSTWKYYSYYTKNVNTMENFKNNMKNGKSVVYYPSGKVFDEVEWVDGKKQGQWGQYYEDGSVKMIAYYENDLLYGCFNVFFENGNPEIVGRYEYNLRHGPWMYFSEEGEKLLEVQYVMGKAMNQEALDKREQEFFKKLDENVGKISEPVEEDFVGF